MTRLAIISVVLCFLAVAFVASANTDINFYFADMLAGVNGGSSGHEDTDSDEVASYSVDQTINDLFYLNTYASNDDAANVVYSNYAPLIQPLSADNVALTTVSPLVNNGTPSTYTGISGLVDYLRGVATARNSSYQQLTNFIYDFSDDLSSVTVRAIFSGVESLEQNNTYQTFFGVRTYVLVADDSKEYGWAVTSILIIRNVTRPSPDWTATFRGAAQQVVLDYFAFNDIAANDLTSNVVLANYGSLLSPFVTDDLVITSNSPLTGNKTYTGGVQAVVNYLYDVSTAREASQQQLSSFQFAFNNDQSSVVVSTKFSGWEQLTIGGAYQTFFGTRTYTLVRGNDGVWRIQSAVIVRSATFTATRAS